MICNLTINHNSCDVDVLTVLGADATFETLQGVRNSLSTDGISVQKRRPGD
jgi:hypothetical protein